MLYIALALVVVLIAAGVLWLRSRSEPAATRTPEPRSRAPEPPAAPSVNPSSITVVDAPAAAPRAAQAGPQDADATMIYRRPGEAPTPVAPPRTADVPSMTLSGVHLVALNGANKGKRFPVATSGITIGRSSGCDIVLTDSCVSSRHAWIGPIEGKITLRDLKSTNGTFLNAQLRTSISEAQLRPGDTIFIGGHLGEQFRFEAD